MHLSVFAPLMVCGSLSLLSAAKFNGSPDMSFFLGSTNFDNFLGDFIVQGRLWMNLVYDFCYMEVQDEWYMQDRRLLFKTKIVAFE